MPIHNFWSYLRIPSKSILTCFVLSTFGLAAACTNGSSSDGNDDESDESGGSGGGGKGGGAGKSGGSGGSKSGGSGGSANGGSGGSANGGSGGSANGGSGGAMVQIPAISGDGVVFSGKDMTLTKLVAGDATPGYFYAAPTADGVKGVKVEAVSDAALPEGTKYAITAELNTAVEGNFIMGWNWREDSAGGKWNYADISQYAGVSFWTKSDTTAAAVAFTGVYMYNDTGFLESSEFGGICAAEPCATPVEYSAVVARKTWTKTEIRFSDFNAGVPKLAATSRVDLLQVRFSAGGPSAKVYITGMKLLKESELAPL